MEKYTMVKSEVQPNGDIFLFYVDENGATEVPEEDENMVTTIEHHDPNQMEGIQPNYIYEEVPIEQVETADIEQLSEDAVNEESWTDVEVKKLLVFYIDNIETFHTYTNKQRHHLWTVACKTMLTTKEPDSCEEALLELKKKYASVHLDILRKKANEETWPYYDLCHQAFHEDAYVRQFLAQNNTVQPVQPTVGINDVDFKTKPKGNRTSDEKAKQMLELYLQYKKVSSKDINWQKHLWEKVAIQLGEDAEYWHKRFLNFKHHYVRMVEKRNIEGPAGIVWPYMQMFDKIFHNDSEFQQKYGKIVAPQAQVPKVQPVLDWNNTEMTVLVKYCFDCYDEFQDPTIPDVFLWNEVGRLLDKNPDDCKTKYEELKSEHLNLYLSGGYDLQTRKPIAILFDNIISKEVEKKLVTHFTYSQAQWSTEKMDMLVNFLFDNLELFKDPVCHFVCWSAAASKLDETIHSCRNQWNNLTMLYKSILNDKKEDSDLQIDWRYIDLFDRIFDYGMDTRLLDGYEKPIEEKDTSNGVRNVKIKQELAEDQNKPVSDDEDVDYDDKSSGKRSKTIVDQKQIQILEYYMKNKDKFGTSQRKKLVLWDVLAKQIGISAEQCADRFRNLKQAYMSNIQREINKPEMPILWPYYNLCKKVFGYRAIKNKLKNSKTDTDEEDEWTTRQIRSIINHLAKNLTEVDSNTDDVSIWSDVAKEIQRSEKACRDKFVELRKSYRKIKTMLVKNPDCKVNWKYFKMFDDVYSGNRSMDVEQVFVEVPPNAIKTEINDDEDFQCLIVIPEGQELKNLDSANITLDDKPEQRSVWTKAQKRALLKHYHNYILQHKDEIINTKTMWEELQSKHFPKRTVKSLKKMYFLLKTRYKKMLEETDGNVQKSVYFKKIKEILSVKAKFVRPPFAMDQVILKERAIYSDVSLPIWKVDKALKYYLEHVEEFILPKYEKRYVWIDLAKASSLSVSKAFRKINYLKQFFNSATNEVNGEKVEFADTLRKILEREFIFKLAMGQAPESSVNEEDETAWKDEETEHLLLWYLNNLDKFKNPKYVPSYLWMEASKVLKKSAVACSKKMSEIRTQYSNMVKEDPDSLNEWRFSELCQKIYGTGKKI